MGDTKRVRAALRARTCIAVGITALVIPAVLTVGAAAPAQAASCTTKTGPNQKQVEKFLKLKVDGRQSSADCKAIRAFQTKNGISPNIGYAGPVTWAAMDAINKQKANRNPNAAGKCPTNKGRIACVDLSRQLSWIQDGKTVKYGPVPIRSGRNGFETRTGLKKVYLRSINHYSTLYHVRMPYSQFFDGGIAFHSVGIAMSAPPGSHGCVNMRTGDAKSYWGLLKKGSNVFVYGRKPGT
ncbi:L,D-transpeptidase family protein [Streptomyces sp. NBC_00237]|uniref:L,D-transpeptidase family protein n=1 Tax=Streptomyces sp. NBC_00237 TaxID=2975687 RepID=UPI00225A5B8F|nr:L,D-transpeptidase family protein [Streptomyces sp. NBC_00237]MCX5204636.1 L,D-transpeptidase family protein [Streptomyces sp. NBC_00237]